MSPSDCPLCQATSPDRIIAQTPQFRVIWGAEVDHPCLVQLIWQAHTKEMADLSQDEKLTLMQAVFAVETAMRDVLQPKKLNIASLGNWVPHVHWHIIPRWEDDAHWPNSIWAAKQRNVAAHGVAQKPALAAAIAQALSDASLIQKTG